MKDPSEIISKIKEKKELSGIDNSVVLSTLSDYLTKNKISLNGKSEKQIKLIVKEIRSELRLLTGRFQKSTKDKISLLNENKITELLKSHSSTFERLDSYNKLKKILDKEKIKSILDLGCGLNPLALANKEIKYFASDINTSDLEIIQKFFDKNKIDGKTFPMDLRKIKDLPKTDACLIFKVLDIIDPKHKLSKGILEKINSRLIIVSFSTKKLSGKKMNFPKRIWFEKLLEQLTWKYDSLETTNEIFYIIKNYLCK